MKPNNTLQSESRLKTKAECFLNVAKNLFASAATKSLSREAIKAKNMSDSIIVEHKSS